MFALCSPRDLPDLDARGGAGALAREVDGDVEALLDGAAECQCTSKHEK
jgi:hypothetical protein